MSKASKIVVLCEDKAHGVFTTRFLKKGWGVNNHIIHVELSPKGKGSGKKFVIDNIAKEVKALRRRAPSTILIVVQDVDENLITQAKASLDKQLEQPRHSDEQIVYVTPKWHIETWLAYLDGKSVDENDKEIYKSKYRGISGSKEAHPLIDRLAEKCKLNLPLDSPPPSLAASCEEFERIRNALKKR